MTDLEGVAGVINFDDYCTPKGRYYEVARELLTKEVNAAIERLLEAGADEFLVVDGHGYGGINPLLLHSSTVTPNCIAASISRCTALCPFFTVRTKPSLNILMS